MGARVEGTTRAPSGAALDTQTWLNRHDSDGALTQTAVQSAGSSGQLVLNRDLVTGRIQGLSLGQDNPSQRTETQGNITIVHNSRANNYTGNLFNAYGELTQSFTSFSINTTHIRTVADTPPDPSIDLEALRQKVLKELDDLMALLAAERNGCDGGCGLLMSNLNYMRYQVSVAPSNVRWGEALKIQLNAFVAQAQSDPGYGGPLSTDDWALIHTLEDDGDRVTQGQGTPGSSSSSMTSTRREALQLTYARDAGGRVIRQDSALMEQAQASWTYEYDTLGRLQTATQVNPNTDAVLQSTRWGYDANGNRNTENGKLIARYDAQDRLLQWKQNLYAYNAAGDLQTRTGPDGSTRYRYDALGNLLQVQLPTGQTIDYTVDPLNRRSSKTVDGQLQWQMLWNKALQPLAQLKPDGSVMSLFLYGDRPNVPEAMVKNGVSYRILTDQLGSVRAVLDTQGQIVQQIDYDPWGRVTLDTNPGFQPFGYAGGIYDPDTQLVRFGARDYDAEVGRWTAKDPIGFGGGESSLYTYVNGNPISYSDPYGLWAWGDPIPQGAVDFSAGFGDTLSLGLTNWARNQMGTNGAVNKCSGYYTAGEVAGVAVDTVIGGAAGWEAAGAKGAGKEFSHWIPNRMGGPRSKWNGNYVPTAEHALSDPYRYQFMPKAWKAENPMPNMAQQQWDRIPNVYKGAAAGGAYGGAGAAMSSDCTCQ